ncbi:MAG TPA: sigma-70 family RNA polymerase sigma factor [Sediminibacterium sp.]|nr:sigma-70 family RNA polymerase sigma factor [Sediminibacterium sp.]
MRKACQGDADAQAWLYQQYSKAMFNICMRMAGNRNDAEDILQDVFILAFKNLAQLKEPAHFGGWLKRIVINECIRQGRKHVNWDTWDESRHEHPPTEDLEWWKTIRFELVHEAIKSLPAGCRQVFNLYVIEDFSHKEIAEQLGITESTSKSQYHRARFLLKDKIQQQLAIHG